MIIFIAVITFIILHCITAYIVRENEFEYKNNERGISILVPCYNEAVILNKVIDNIPNINYNNFELIFINDGSTDKTFEQLKSLLYLKEYNQYQEKIITSPVNKIYKSTKYSNCYVIDKMNGGKGDSLNAGINLASKEYCLTLDADCILKSDALIQINNSLDDSTIAIGGNVIPAQCIHSAKGDILYSTKTNRVVLVQFLEYAKGFLILKESYAKHNSLIIISGAFGVFNKKALLCVNGYDDTIGEDIDITIKIQKYAKINNMKVNYNKRAICFTEVPNNYKDLIKQRIRWQKAFVDAIKNHFGFFVKNIIKPISLFTFIENIFISYVSNIITIIASIYVIQCLITRTKFHELFYFYIITGLIVLLFQTSIAFKLMKINNMIRYEGNRFKLLLVILYEIFIYRYIMICVTLWGTIEYPFNKKAWNKLERYNDTDIEI